MAFVSELKEYVQNEIEDKTSPPESVDFKKDEDGGFIVRGWWNEDHKMNSLYEAFPDVKYQEETVGHQSEEFLTRPVNYTITISSDNPLAEKMEDLHTQFWDSLTLKENAIHWDVLFKSLSSTNNPFYNSEDSDFVASVLIRVEDVNMEKTLEALSDKLTGIEDSFTKDQFETVELAFDDRQVNQLISSMGDVRTTKPHRYFKGVDSTEAYVDKIADNDDEKERLVEQDDYIVFYRTDAPDELPDNELKEAAEGEIDSVINDVVSFDGDWMYEANGLILEEGESQASFFIKSAYTVN